jgi:hypothetical protein
MVLNHQDQPIELHLPAGVLVLGPRQEAEIQAADLTAPAQLVFGVATTEITDAEDKLSSVTYILSYSGLQTFDAMSNE